MDIKSLYREIVNEHNLHPTHKYNLMRPSMVLNGINPSCGDDINLQLEVKDGVITEASFNGSGCAISQASADMMIDLVVGKTLEEALETEARFMRMIRGEATEEEVEELDEAAALSDISHMPARVKCAVLGWRTMREMIEKIEEQGAQNSTMSAAGSEACGVCEREDCDKR